MEGKYSSGWRNSTYFGNTGSRAGHPNPLVDTQANSRKFHHNNGGLLPSDKRSTSFAFSFDGSRPCAFV